MKTYQRWTWFGIFVAVGAFNADALFAAGPLVGLLVIVGLAPGTYGISWWIWRHADVDEDGL